jgi:divalent metal cation (Fe/Co/Zn/Cd) transporter
VSVGHLCSVIALFVMGTYLLVESIIKLLSAEYPTIISVEIFGQTIWLGWLMLPALAYSALPSVFLGRAKIPLAEELHNKVLYADAKMNKANWLTAGAAMVGVAGIGFGLWWADAAAAAIISLEITKDGVSNLRRAVVDLMDQTPTTVHGDEADPLRGKLAAMLQDLDWVEEVDLRLREEGQVYFGEAFVRGGLRGALRGDRHHAEGRRCTQAGPRPRLEDLRPCADAGPGTARKGPEYPLRNPHTLQPSPGLLDPVLPSVPMRQG